jgi:hypothetical protein
LPRISGVPLPSRSAIFDSWLSKPVATTVFRVRGVQTPLIHSYIISGPTPSPATKTISGHPPSMNWHAAAREK